MGARGPRGVYNRSLTGNTLSRVARVTREVLGPRTSARPARTTTVSLTRSRDGLGAGLARDVRKACHL